MSVYQPCDIRGPVEALSPELYYRWGAVLGTQVIERGRPTVPPVSLPAGVRTGQVVIGGDVRTTTPRFLAALDAGLRQAGAVVTNLGVLPTPMLYFAHRRGGYAAVAIVTASHNPPRFNGLKWMIGQQPPTEADVGELRRRTEALPAVAVTLPPDSLARTGSDAVAADYGRWLEEAFPRRPGRGPLRVVVDPGHGCWSGRATAYLPRVFPSAEFSSIFDTPDGRFPGRDPDCAKPSSLAALSDAVRQRQADLGIAFDGDGDRVAFVDSEGVVLTAEQATWVLLHAVGPGLRGRALVYDLKFSDLVARAAGEWGATALPERSGHAFIRARMIREQAAFGAEISGHYFHGDLGCGDDGLYSACRVLAYLLDSRQSLAALRRACPPVFLSPDLRLRMPGQDRAALIEQVRQAFADRPQGRIDGTRIDFDGGWALVRASVTEPSLTLRFEGRDAEALEQVVQEFCSRLGDLGRRVHALYHAE